MPSQTYRRVRVRAHFGEVTSRRGYRSRFLAHAQIIRLTLLIQILIFWEKRLTIVNQTFQKLSKVVKSCQTLSNVVKRCQTLSNVVKRCQTVAKLLAKNCPSSMKYQTLTNFERCCYFFENNINICECFGFRAVENCVIL